MSKCKNIGFNEYAKQSKQVRSSPEGGGYALFEYGSLYGYQERIKIAREHIAKANKVYACVSTYKSGIDLEIKKSSLRRALKNLPQNFHTEYWKFRNGNLYI
jgi:hypothetical protein